jgi:hypothetical protein
MNTNPYAPPADRSRQTSSSLPRDRLQAVGRRCAICEKTIAVARDAASCIACQRAYHATCLEDPDRCARCGQSMSVLEAEAEEADARTTEDARRRGRVLFWAVVVLFATFDALLVVVQLSGGNMSRSVSSVIRVALEVFLVWRTLKGSVGTRRVLATFSGLGAIVSAVGVLASGGKPIAAARLALMTLLCIFATWVFGLSKDASAYLDAGRDGSER